MYRDATNVEPEMYDYTSNNWSHWNSNEKIIIIIIIIIIITIATHIVQLATSRGKDIIQHKFLLDETTHRTAARYTAGPSVSPVQQPEVREGRGDGKT